MTSVGESSNEGTSDLRSFSAQTLRRGGDAFRSLLQSETLGSIVLLLAVVVALVWANIAPAGYDGTWESVFGLRLRTHEVDHTLREWVNSGLMTVFFVVVGLEARREFDLGELRERSRLAMPVAVGILAMAIPVGIFIAANVSSGNAGAWGVAMSSDTALALGALSVLRGSNGDRLRIHLVTILVVDDLVSIIVVATVYSSSVSWVRVGIAVGVLAILVLAVRFGMRQLVPFVVLGFVAWAALFGSGIDPIAAGLAIGLAAPAFTPRRESLERATSTFRAFREEPTPELARTATAAVSDTQSMNARLQRIFVPWSAFLIVPLFALANAGVRLDGDSLRAAATSPIT
ncbi:hypothetical protein GCM10027169_11330 [Gordonia jinhuaensis]|uniref:Na+/H+ antiporter NhaA n=1 Tax=Gordonia jinhuaensis TaxID=1517702 RepID=A0A916WUA4_9ACTN|nr:hypothetical protein GCM10011489_19260 [Gordonia jinhuaensis]